MLIYILRHGETEANLSCIIQGQTNSPLTPYGISLAEAVGHGMRDLHFDRCICSPLGRAMQTAEVVLKESGNAIAIETDDRIMEINLGEWEGKKLKDVAGEMQSYFSAPSSFKESPGGETLEQVCERTQAFLQELADCDDEKTYLIVTHGCAYRAMLNRLYGDNADFWHGRIPPNCAVSVVEAVGGSCKLLEDDRLFFDPATIEGYHEGRL